MTNFIGYGSCIRCISYIFVFFLSLSSVFVVAATSTPTSTLTSTSTSTSTSRQQGISPANGKTNPGRIWNLQDADIISVINQVSLETGKNFVIDPRVTGKISLVSSKPIQSDQVYDLFLSVLELLGFSAIPSGDVVKIVPNAQAEEFATRVATSQSPGKGDEVVVRIIGLENISATQILPVIRPLVPQWSLITAYIPGNALIVLGRASNIERIDQLIHKLDNASGSDIDIIPLRRASAGQLVAVITNLQNAGRANGDVPQVSIVPDERTNSILLSGNKAARFRTRLLINHLDTPTSGAQGNTEVIYLRYLQAKTFAPILGKIAQNIAGKETENLRAGDLNASINGSSEQGRPENLSSSSIMGLLSHTNTGSSGKTSASKSPENKTNIQAEPSTNALVITAPPSLMEALNTVIAKLDIRPAQVLVEAIIVELDQNDTKNLGIQWGGLPGTSTVQGNNFPSFGQGVVGIIPNMQIQAVLSALQTNTGADILSTPSIVVLDNHKATLAVGQQVPDQTGQYATTGSSSTVTPFNTINRLDVQLHLDVTPQINLGDAVRLNIKLKNDSLQNPDNPTLNPTTNTSSIQNSVIVNNTDVLVIGGLMSNNIASTLDKIPILGDIPVIGLLFQHKTRRLEKKNLMVFIKSTILHTPEDASAITNTKYSMIRQAQINWPEDLTYQGTQKLQNVLVPLHSAQLPQPFDEKK